MNKISKIFSFISALFAVLIISFLISIAWNYAKNSLLYSCVDSVASDLAEYSPEKLQNSARNDDEWYVLNDDEAQSALENISPQNCSESNSQPLDMKERKFKIAIKGTKKGFRVLVWSKGFDNISGTQDDFVSPSDEKVPQ